MSQLLAYLAAQARSQPGSTLRFVAGELWRRGRARMHPKLDDGLAVIGSKEFQASASLFVPPAALDLSRISGAAWIEDTIARAERISHGEFEIFGQWVALGSQPDWHRDWNSGYCWPLEHAGGLRVLDAPPGSDVKRPWELTRFHHGLTLTAAAAFTRDPRFTQCFASLVQHWIAWNPWPRGIHWAMPMEAAIRAINWIQAAAIAAASDQLDGSFSRELSRCLFLHGRHLWAFREWNPVARANHYLACVVGLIWLGALFESTPEGRQWLEFGRVELLREMTSQTGSDGVVREGSSGYHAFVTELFLSAALVLVRRAARAQGQISATNGNLAAAIGRATSPAFAATLPRMFEFLSALCAGRQDENGTPIWGDTDDGRVLPFGGAAIPPVRVLAAVGNTIAGRPQTSGSAPLDAETFWRFGPAPDSTAPHACAPGHRSQAFDDSGFYFFSSPRVRGSIRCGPLGVGGWANHAHNDQLSFEFSLDGSSVIVDPGLPCYSEDPAVRNLFRSTRYHNTIEVGGAEQSRFWPALLFRIVDDTRSRTHLWRADSSDAVFDGSHSGYSRLPGCSDVGRELRLMQDDTLAVRDVVDLAEATPTAWYFHLAPGIVPEIMHSEATAPTAPGTKAHSRWRLGPVLLSVWTAFAPRELESHCADGWVSPRFGRKLPAQILEFRSRRAGRLVVHFIFTPANPPGRAEAPMAKRP